MTTWSVSSDGSLLQALLAAVARSPILARATRAARLSDWAAVRKSGHADAFVLAWLARQARSANRAPRVLN